MSLPPGTRLGPYEVTAQIGVGGMGEVYRATDTNLKRSVAIKVLPESVAGDRDRLARFQREAEVLAALNHPNIAHIYGVEKSDGMTALVMELVEGPTLDDLIRAGQPDGERVSARWRDSEARPARESHQPPAPGVGPRRPEGRRAPLGLRIDEALPIAKQIAEALEAAHERGIIHRDLKPANIKVRDDGTVKVLDFGLAKALGPDGASAPARQSQAPTITSPAMTEMGVVLGTAAYMSPEQARGKAVDKRTDIWAFGCVLYEMLAAKPAFAGETYSDVVAHVLSTEPDWTALPSGTPTSARRLIQRCLQKDVRHRLRDIGDARIDLSIDDLPMELARNQLPRRPGWQTAGAAAALLLAGAVVGGMLSPTREAAPPAPQPVARFTLPPPPGVALVIPNALGPLALSPDSRYAAFESIHTGQRWLYLHDLATGDTRVVTETSAGHPFFSPDSVWLGFFERGKLLKVPVRGGAPIPLAEAPGPRGASWGSDDVIVFAPDARTGLSEVNAAGGPVRSLTSLDATQGETSHRGPVVLPGGRAIVYRAEGSTYATGVLALFSRDGGRQRVLVAEGGFQPAYSPTGHLLYLQGGNLMAAAVDAARPEMTGTPAVVMEDVGTFAVSDTGTLIYAAAAGPRRVTLAWVDRRGRAESLPLTPRNLTYPRLTADERRVVVAIQERAQRDVWTYDMERGTLSRLTADGSSDWPVWTADGRGVLYASNRPGTVWDVFRKAADGTTPGAPLVAQPEVQIPRDVSPDGRLMAYQSTTPETGADIWLFQLQAEGAPVPFARSPASERWPAFSPDSRWIAYTSNESGRDEIYVRAVDGGGGNWQISNGGGVEPRWNPAGRELFYRDGGRMLAVDVAMGASFSAGAPRPLFEDASYPLGGFGTNYDVAHDGTRFLMVKEELEPLSRPLNVVTHWFEELKHLVPTN